MPLLRILASGLTEGVVDPQVTGFIVVKKPDSLSPPAVVLLLLLAVGLGAYYRFVDLGSRPMHTDEAILATKLGTFWNGGGFQYDPSDYHGPFFHYVTWFWGRLAGWGEPGEWTEAELRSSVAVCGLLLILTTLLFREMLGLRGTLVAMILMAVSPMMVFYSRYFIMEMLLVLLIALSLFAFWRWHQTGGKGWLLLCGALIGMQHATKETFVLNVGAAVVGWLVAGLIVTDRASSGLRIPTGASGRMQWKPWHWVGLSAVLVSVICFSAGFRDWVAVKESATTYANYLERSGGSGHEKEWHYYLTLIFWRKDGLIWTEALIGGLGLVGMIYAFLGDHREPKQQRFLVFITLYTMILFAAYSMLSYKTPWSILSAQHALTLLAGVGAAVLWNAFQNGFLRMVYKVALGLGIYHLCSESMIAIDAYKADPRNPYVYAHTSTHLLTLVQTVRELDQLEPNQPLTVQVINRDSGWPLPWYFRKMSKVGYYQTVPDQLDADVVIAEDQMLLQVEGRLANRDYQDTGLHGLRPGIPMIMKVRLDFWRRLMDERARRREEVSAESK